MRLPGFMSWVGVRQVWAWHTVGFRLVEGYLYHVEVYLRYLMLQALLGRCDQNIGDQAPIVQSGFAGPPASTLTRPWCRAGVEST